MRIQKSFVINKLV